MSGMSGRKRIELSSKPWPFLKFREVDEGSVMLYNGGVTLRRSAAPVQVSSSLVSLNTIELHAVATGLPEEWTKLGS